MKFVYSGLPNLNKIHHPLTINHNLNGHQSQSHQCEAERSHAVEIIQFSVFLLALLWGRIPTCNRFSNSLFRSPSRFISSSRRLIWSFFSPIARSIDLQQGRRKGLEIHCLLYGPCISFSLAPNPNYWGGRELSLSSS